MLFRSKVQRAANKVEGFAALARAVRGSGLDPEGLRLVVLAPTVRQVARPDFVGLVLTALPAMPHGSAAHARTARPETHLGHEALVRRVRPGRRSAFADLVQTVPGMGRR